MSTSDQDQAREAARRKFDEVASLFGPIVPPPGSPVRLRTPGQSTALPQAADASLSPEAGPRLAPPPKLRAPPVETLRSRPPPEPLAVPAVRQSAPTRLDLPPPASPRPKPQAQKSARADRGAPEVPWPDAFAPRANYRSVRRSRLWYWVFLIPFAAVVAAAITLVDPRSIRTFVDQTLPQYLPPEVTQFFARPAAAPAKPAPFPPVLPPPASSAISPPDPAPVLASPAPTPLAAPQAVTEQPVPTPPQPAETATPVEPAPPPETPPAVAAAPSDPPAPQETPALAAQTAPEPPTVSSANQPIPLPPAPPPAVAAPIPAASPRVTIYYRRNQPAAENEARRLAAKAGNAEIRPSSTTSRTPLIYYFSAADREAATSLARNLANEGAAGWIVRPGPARPNAGAIEVLLP